MKMSDDIKEFAVAFSKAQGLMKNASKDASNPFFKSSYASLASVIEALREPFAANGLSFSQPCRVHTDGSIIVETMIIHSSGQYIMGEITGKPVKNDPQSVGSLISYLKRYLLQAMVGIASEDDDSEAAMGRGSNHDHKVNQSKNTPVPKATENKLVTEFKSKLSSITKNYSDKEKLDRILKEFDIKSSKEIPSLSEDNLRDMLIKLDDFR
jgi:hypothetical protein